ncbi:cytochrome P450, partial [Aureobasidium melanogenum]
MAHRSVCAVRFHRFYDLCESRYGGHNLGSKISQSERGSTSSRATTWDLTIDYFAPQPSPWVLSTRTEDGEESSASDLTGSQHLTSISFADWIVRSSVAPDLDGMEPLSILTRSTNPIAENHLGKVLDDHIDRADQGVAEVDLAQIAERFSIQAFSNMVFGQNLAESDVRVISRTVSRGQLGFMMMTMFPWIRICVGGLSALLKLDQYLAFGKTLAAVKKTATDRLAGSTCASSATNLNATQIADNLNVQIDSSSYCSFMREVPTTAGNYTKLCQTRARRRVHFITEEKRLSMVLGTERRVSTALSSSAPLQRKAYAAGGLSGVQSPRRHAYWYSICLGAAMRDLEVFGANPDEYDPSRWMTSRRLGDTQSESLANMTNVLELNFGSGISKCLGQKVALLELAVFLSKVSLHQTVARLKQNDLTEYEWEPTKDPGEFGVVVKRETQYRFFLVHKLDRKPINERVERQSLRCRLKKSIFSRDRMCPLVTYASGFEAVVLSRIVLFIPDHHYCRRFARFDRLAYTAQSLDGIIMEGYELPVSGLVTLIHQDLTGTIQTNPKSCFGLPLHFFHNMVDEMSLSYQALVGHS